MREGIDQKVKVLISPSLSNIQKSVPGLLSRARSPEGMVDTQGRHSYSIRRYPVSIHQILCRAFGYGEQAIGALECFPAHAHGTCVHQAWKMLGDQIITG